MKVDPEPQYPLKALEPCPTNLRSDPCPAEDAEDLWWNQTLSWGRTHHDRLARVCRWAEDLGLEVPDGYCGS